MTNLAETDTTPAARPPHASVGMARDAHSCGSPVHRSQDLSFSLLPPHTHTNPSAPEMTIGASTRVEPRGSLPRGVPKPRPPNPFHGRSARAPSLPPRRVAAVVAPPRSDHITAPAPTVRAAAIQPPETTDSRPRPLPPRPRPRDRKTARRKREIPSEGEGRALLHAAAAPGFTAPRAAGSASGAQETPRRAPCRWRSHQSPLCALLALLPRGFPRRGRGGGGAMRGPDHSAALFPAVVAEV